MLSCLGVLSLPKVGVLKCDFVFSKGEGPKQLFQLLEMFLQKLMSPHTMITPIVFIFFLFLETHKTQNPPHVYIISDSEGRIIRQQKPVVFWQL